MKLEAVISEFEKLWPTSSAEEWDVVGLVSGKSSQEIKSILLTVDVTHEVVAEAKELGVDLILAHHPLLLKGINSVAEQTSKGSLLAELIRSNIALFAAHTNADSQPTGTSAVIAKSMGLINTKPLVASNEGNGIGIIGDLAQDLTLGEIAGLLNELLPQTATGVRVAGEFERKVKRVALCAGAGDAYLQVALDSHADLYITSDLRHHPAQEILEQAKARSLSFALMDISHWAAEYLWLSQAAFELKSLDLEIQISDVRTDVFDFLMNLPRSDSELG